MDETDSELVARTRAGDKQAFGRLIERYQPRAIRIALRVAAREEVARELAHEALLQAYLSLDRLRDDSRFASWLQGIVRNLCRTHLRDRQRSGISWESLDQEPSVIAPAALDPELVAQQREQQRQVLDAVHSLSPANRDATLLFYYEQLSLQEIAAALGTSVGAVKVRLHQSRKQLREPLLALYPEGAMTMPGPRTSKKMVKVSVLTVGTGSAPIDRENPAASDAHARHFLRKILMSAGHTGDWVGLTDETGSRFLPIRADWPMKKIEAVLNGSAADVAPALALMVSLLKAAGTTLQAVRIQPLSRGIAHASIRIHQGATEREVDARPGDGIALAVQAGIPISIAEALMKAGAWDLSDPVPVVERLLHSPDESSLRRAAEEPFLIRVADAILEHLRLHVPTQGDSCAAELIIGAEYPPHHRPDSLPLVYMTYLYGGNFGGSNVPMPVSVLPVLTARFKLMAGLNPREREIAQQGHTPVSLKERQYDLRVATEPISAPTADPSTWGTLAPGYEHLKLRLDATTD